MSKNQSPTEAILDQTFNTTAVNFKDLYSAGALIDPERETVDHMDVAEHISGVVEYPDNFKDQLDVLGLTSSVKISVIRGVEGAIKYMRAIKYAPCPPSDSTEEYPEYLIINHALGRHTAQLEGQEYPLDVPEIGSDDEVEPRPSIEGLRSMSQANLVGLAHTMDLLQLSPHILKPYQATALRALSTYLPVYKQAWDEQQAAGN